MRLLLILFRTGFSVQRRCVPAYCHADVQRTGIYQGRCIHGRLCLIHRYDHHLPYPFPTEIQIHHPQHTPYSMPYTDSLQSHHNAHQQHCADDCGMFHLRFLPYVGNVRMFLKHATHHHPCRRFLNILSGDIHHST